MTLWFTADLHLGHKNIIKYCNRPFENVEMMDKFLIDSWNMAVGEKDHIWILGDFAFRDFEGYNRRLHGNKHFIKGSHDDIPAGYNALPMVILKKKLWYPEHPEYPDNITLCHYAMRSWDKSHYGTWSLFGHHHGMLEPYGLSFDVGVDCWDYFPVSIEEVAEKMKTLKPIVDFSHKENDE
jgi:calcineurin-like phosphoesterase family protein